jgi:type VI protein secretion system component Hcp
VEGFNVIQQEKCSCVGSSDEFQTIAYHGKVARETNQKSKLYSIDLADLDTKRKDKRTITFYVDCPNCKGIVTMEFTFGKAEDTGEEVVFNAIYEVQNALIVPPRVAGVIVKKSVRKAGWRKIY